MLSHFSHIQLFVTPWTTAHQAPLSMGFSRQEYWCGLSCPSPGDLPDPGIKPESLVSPALIGRFFTTSTTLMQSKCQMSWSSVKLDSVRSRGRPRGQGWKVHGVPWGIGRCSWPKSAWWDRAAGALGAWKARVSRGLSKSEEWLEKDDRVCQRPALTALLSFAVSAPTWYTLSL